MSCFAGKLFLPFNVPCFFDDIHFLLSLPASILSRKVTERIHDIQAIASPPLFLLHCLCLPNLHLLKTYKDQTKLTPLLSLAIIDCIRPRAEVEVPDFDIPAPHVFRPRPGMEESGTWIPVSRPGTGVRPRAGVPAAAAGGAMEMLVNVTKFFEDIQIYFLVVGNGKLTSIAPRPAVPIPTIILTPPSPRHHLFPPPPPPPPNPNDLVVFSLPAITYTTTSSPTNTNPIFTITILNTLAMSTNTPPHNAGLSQSWISPAASNLQRYQRLQTNASHLGVGKSPFFPQSATEWNRHCADVKGADARKERGLLEEKIEALKQKKGRVVSAEGMGEKGDERKIVECGLKFKDQTEGGDYEQSMKREVGWSSGRSAVLGEKTAFWAGGEEVLKEGKVDEENGMRAFWPDMSELKTEGEMRAKKTRQRRFPLPRIDLYSTGMLRHFIPPAANLTAHEKNALIEQIIAKNRIEDIAWHERQVVPFKYALDRLPSLDKIWEQNEKTENGGSYLEPKGGDHGKGKGKEQLAVRAGDKAEEDQEVRDEGEEYKGGCAKDDLNAPRTRDMNSDPTHADGTLQSTYFNPTNFVFGAQTQNYVSYGSYGPQQPEGNTMANPYDGIGLPASYSYASEGPGNGKRPPTGGWMFDELELKKNKDWADLLDELDCVADEET
ncbi:hypothetical protein VTL71DRAFT_10275 [Oculimacula yallundae]|uniref:Uncharacterized protein n=1 Tax=Oculimacula yallundae TaxID=86028 RepID=A0ABR4CU44_9HELO